MSKRDIATVQSPYEKLQDIHIDTFSFDYWQAFASVFGQIELSTKYIKGVNNSFRARNRRLVRKTNAFLKNGVSSSSLQYYAQTKKFTLSYILEHNLLFVYGFEFSIIQEKTFFY